MQYVYQIIQQISCVQTLWFKFTSIKMALKWGIASAGRISHDFASALGSEPKDEHIVTIIH